MMDTNQTLSFPLYPRLLGTSWLDLHVAVRRSHLEGAILRSTGTFKIRHGNRLLARFLVRLLRLPSAAEAVATRLCITQDGRGETWFRTFGDCPLVTTQQESPGGLLAERLGIIEFRFRLLIVGEGLSYRQTDAALRLGPLGVSLPRWMSPQVEAQEGPVAGGCDQVQVKVKVTVPLAGHLISYEGHITSEASPP